MKILNLGIFSLIFNVASAYANNGLEKRGTTAFTAGPSVTNQVIGTVATQATTCSLSAYDHGYPSATVSYEPVIKELEGGLYEAVMHFQGTDC